MGGGRETVGRLRLDLDLGTPAVAAGPAVASLDYRIPDRYLIAPPVAAASIGPDKGAVAAAAGFTYVLADLPEPLERIVATKPERTKK